MASPKNERNTENVVRDELRRLGYYNSSNQVRVEEQKSGIESVRRLLRSASKTGGSGSGFPEFIISEPGSPDVLVIVECKADQRDHASTQASAL